MASLADYYRVVERDGVKRFTYVCGPDRLLVEEIVDDVRRRVEPNDLDYVVLYAGEVKDKEIWAQVNQYTATQEIWVEGERRQRKRLVVVRDAEKVKSWAGFEDWITSGEMGRGTRAQVVVLFVGSDHEWSPDRMPDVRDRIIKSGLYVKAGPLKDEAAVEYLCRSGKVDAHHAKYLLDRVGHDLDAAANCVRKMKYFQGTLNEQAIDRLTTRAPADDFVHALVNLKMKQAISAIEQVPESEFGRIFATLDTKLVQLYKVNKATRRNANFREIVVASKLESFQVKELMDAAKYYDANRVRKAVSALNFVDSSWANGARDGLLEALVATW